MKKLIALSIFLFLITFTSFNFIKSYAFSNVTFDVISYFDDQNQTNNTIINAAYGSSLSFENNLGSMSNYVFEAWVINGVVEFAANINTTFPITNNMNVKALFSPSDRHLAVFIDSNSKYLGHDYVIRGGVAVASGFVEPTKPGYQVAAEKWNRPLHNITDDIMFVLQYEKTLLECFHIAVFQGFGTGSYLFNSQVTVIANQSPSGQFFSNWTNSNGIVVSSNPTYTFTALNPQTLTANFSSIPPIEVPLLVRN